MLCSYVPDRYELHEIPEHNFVKAIQKDLTSLTKLKESCWSEHFDKEGKFMLSKTNMIGSPPSDLK